MPHLLFSAVCVCVCVYVCVYVCVCVCVCKVFVDIRQPSGGRRPAHESQQMPYPHPGVSLERARELVCQKLDQDPSFESLRDILDHSSDVTTVTGMRCVGVPMGTTEFEFICTRQGC